MDLNWREALTPPTATISEALRILDSSGLRMVMVADDDGRLLGVITDGDIRRALLKRVDLGCPVTDVMNRHPRTAESGEPCDSLRTIMEHHSILHLPLVDGGGRVVGLETYHHLLARQHRENWVFLMAGGFGKRLRPLTDACPKPMLLVDGKPILQSILERFVAAGFRYFYISVYYLADQIKEHFGDGSRWGVTIRYVEETSPLGTAGALGLLPDDDDLPVIIMNGDVLTHLDLNAMLEFHDAQRAMLTLCVREYEMHVPFGVVEGVEAQVTHVVEKPVHRFFVNAGIYVVAPDVVRRVRPPRQLDMPDLVASLIAEKEKVSMFPIHEYWLDVGRPDDYARAQKGRDRDDQA